MVLPLHSGFASSYTDGGLTLGKRIDPQSGYWGLRPDGTLNTALLTNLAHRAVHTMSLVLKDIIVQFYGVDSFRSYYTGCSQGGRMGYHSASRYPSDFDGILAVAPALSPELLGPGDFWPFIVMAQEKQLVPTCVFETFQREIIKYCDPLDGLTDGLISHHDLLESCPFDPSTVIGKVAQCGKNTSIPVTEAHARIAQKIMDGVRDEDNNLLWYGLSTGATFNGIANTTLRNNSLVPAPFAPAAGWLRGMILRNFSANIFDLTREEYFAAFNESMEIGDKIIGTGGLDLTGFRSAGEKMLTWVGLSDEFINPGNFFRFHDCVAASLPSDVSIDEIYRVFTAPGVGHCHGGTGPLPLDAMGALINWVENGIPPETLRARSKLPNGRVASRNLCKYPAKPYYIGGDIYDSNSFVCRDDRRQDGSAEHVIG
ncbi:Tannase/feruloyl esterase [Aspergillus keveii]|uniref:Carboxylic ester hydrolase n=1 Tax=Aspergillus keveii TaxID=714993 RepID=A0ABR4GIZ5_9EURO